MDTKETKTRTKLFVATPMYGGMCHGVYTHGMIKMVSLFVQKNINFAYAYTTNESLVTRGRNSLADRFMESDCTHLMFIDSDIGFEPADIIPMLEADKDILCGLYPKKEINWPKIEQAVKSGVPMEELYKYAAAVVGNPKDTSLTGETDQPMEIINGGTGFMLIHRRVFAGLAGKVPEYNSDSFLAADVNRKQKVIKEYFATSIDKTAGHRLLSEDYHFCKIAKEQGFTVWMAPWARLTHSGSYNFGGALSSAY